MDSSWWQIALTALVSAAGWFVGSIVSANANYKKNRQLEQQREERERRGSLRRANALLRIAIRSLEPFFYSFKNLQFNDALRAWHKLEDLLDEPGVAIALEAEYPALEAFLARFGTMIAMAQLESEKWGDPKSSSYGRPDDEKRKYLASLFADPIPLLGDAIEAIGSTDVREDFAKLKRVANDFRASNGYPPIP